MNIHQAKTHLSRLLRLVAAGEEIVIAKAGRPVARLVPITERRGSRPLGTETGRMVISDDFDAPLPPNLLSGFDGADPG